MGDDVPPELPELDPLKWYCVTVLPHQDMTPATGCDQEPFFEIECCRTGGTILFWIDNGFECVDGAELCVVTGFTAQLLIDIEGPFDTHQDCIDSGCGAL